MPTTMILAWFAFGFFSAAVLLYGPVIAKACLTKAKATSTMKAANEKFGEVAEMLKKYAGLQQEVNDALRKEGQAIQELLDAEVKYGELQVKYGELQDNYIALLGEHSSLLEKTGGNAEGTA